MWVYSDLRSNKAEVEILRDRLEVVLEGVSEAGAHLHLSRGHAGVDGVVVQQVSTGPVN